MRTMRSSPNGRRHSRRVLLVQPPYGDFTYPYHSLAYVAAPLTAAGYAVDLVDFNALWFRSLFSAEQIAQWRQEIAATIGRLNQRERWDLTAQTEFVGHLRSLAILDALRPAEAVAVFRSEEFYRFERYRWARSQVRAFEQLLSTLYPPYDFFGAFALPPYEPHAERLVEKALASQRFIADVRRLLGDRVNGDYLFCGITFPFSAHLALGFAMFAAMRELFPGSVLVAGGTAISDVFKYRADARTLQPFQRLCDFFYVGEAETAVVEFAAWCRGDRAELPAQAIDLAVPEVPRRMSYVSLSTHDNGRFHPYTWGDGAPDYGWVDWSLYLAPERQINYAPSRGCFWNRCTFCDYGLNDTGPTAPSREMDPAVVVAHLDAYARQGIRRVYFAVDALSPKFLDRFAHLTMDEKLDIRWSSQFFITRHFTPELVTLLDQTGACVASFGLESGSERVLELMGKGTRRVERDLRPAFDAFRRSRIGLQPQFFFGFPGETDDDRQLTVDLLREYADIFVTISKAGLFDLLLGSFVAKDPVRYGLRGVRRRAGDDIAGTLEYEHQDGTPPPRCDAFRRFNAQLPSCKVFERPWAGGIDTLHTQLYVERYGRSVFHTLRELPGVDDDPWGDVDVTTGFDVNEVLENIVIHGALGSDASCALPTLDRQAARDVLSVPVEAEAAARTFHLRLSQYREI